MNANQPKHPVQPLIMDAGIKRFKANAIVRFLLDAGPYDMNKLACMPFCPEDREQFAQLIGYSLCGFGDLSYVSDETYQRASGEKDTNKPQTDTDYRKGTALSYQGILDAIKNSLINKQQWLNMDKIDNALEYHWKAEALIELLEVHNCGSTGGFDKDQPHCKTLQERFDWLEEHGHD